MQLPVNISWFLYVMDNIGKYPTQPFIRTFLAVACKYPNVLDNIDKYPIQPQAEHFMQLPVNISWFLYVIGAYKISSVREERPGQSSDSGLQGS